MSQVLEQSTNFTVYVVCEEESLHDFPKSPTAFHVTETLHRASSLLKSLAHTHTLLSSQNSASTSQPDLWIPPSPTEILRHTPTRNPGLSGSFPPSSSSLHSSFRDPATRTCITLRRVPGELFLRATKERDLKLRGELREPGRWPPGAADMAVAELWLELRH